MTVIAFDGDTVAADKMGSSCGLGRTVTKLSQDKDGNVLAFTGHAAFGQMLVAWFKDGADPNKFPPMKAPDDHANLIVFTPKKKILMFENYPVPIVIEDKLFACGDGRDFALGAMRMGACAKQAVKIASEFGVNCGRGIDSFYIDPL